MPPLLALLDAVSYCPAAELFSYNDTPRFTKLFANEKKKQK